MVRYIDECGHEGFDSISVDGRVHSDAFVTEVGRRMILAVAAMMPSAVGDEALFYTFPHDQIHWQMVDEVIPDSVTTYVYVVQDSYRRDLYNLENITVYGVIRCVTVSAVVARFQDQLAYAKTAIKTNGTAYNGSEETITTASYVWRRISTDYLLNPQTSAAWTREEIDALQAGVSLKSNGAPLYYWTTCTQVRVEVAYVPGGVVTGEVALSGEGTLICIVRGTLRAGATVLGVGNLAGIGYLTLTGDATLTGIGALATIGKITLTGDTTLTGVGTLSVLAGYLLAGAGTITGVGMLSGSAYLTAGGRVVLTGVGSLATSGVLTLTGDATLAGAGSLICIARGILPAVIVLSGAGSLAALARILLYGKTVLTGVGTLATSAALFKGGSVTLTGVGTLIASGYLVSILPWIVYLYNRSLTASLHSRSLVTPLNGRTLVTSLYDRDLVTLLNDRDLITQTEVKV
jgi:hypothetical protein